MELKITDSDLANPQRTQLILNFIAEAAKSVPGLIAVAPQLSEPERLHAEAQVEQKPIELSSAPEVAFGSPAPFVPLAPSTAAAAPSSTAPVVSPAITSAATPIAPVPPAVTPANTDMTAAPQSANPAFDAKGLPWDARIHSSSKALNADGTWRKMRGCAPALVATVEAELLGAVPAVPAAANSPAAMILPAVPADDFAEQLKRAQSGPLPIPPAAPLDPIKQFTGLIGRTSAAIAAGKISAADVQAICATHGLAALPLLGTRLDLLPAIAAEIDARIA